MDLALDVLAPAAGPKNQILIAVGDVVERDGREGFNEDTPASGAQRVLDSAVDDHHVAPGKRASLGADGHLDLPLEHVHHLLGVLVGVARHHRPRFIANTAQQHLLAADRM
jgi:hypothetical protein